MSVISVKEDVMKILLSSIFVRKNKIKFKRDSTEVKAWQKRLEAMISLYSTQSSPSFLWKLSFLMHA